MIRLQPAGSIYRSVGSRTLLVLLALVLAVQGLSVGATAVRGKPHTHREPVLVDFRRDLGHSTDRAEGLTAWLGHHHGTARRHHHAADDLSVVFSAADLVADQAVEDGSFSLDLTLAAFIAFVSTWIIGSLAGLSHRKPAGNGWQPTTGWTTRLERPPQAA